MGPPSAASSSWASRLRPRPGSGCRGPPRPSLDHLRCQTMTQEIADNKFVQNVENKIEEGEIEKEKGDNTVSWSTDLPMLVLLHIFDKLVSVDQLCFSLVCKYWKSAYSIRKGVQPRKGAQPLIPLLLLPTKRRGKVRRGLKRESTKKRYLYDVVSGRVLRQKLEVAYGKRFCGSCYGWLGTVDKVKGCDDQLAISLINPYKRHHPPIKLPPLKCTLQATFECSIGKLILTLDPALHPNEFTAVVCFSASTLGKLAMFKAPYNYWVYVEDPRPPLYKDAIVHKDSVYVVGRWNNMVSFSLKDPNWPPKINRVSPRRFEDSVEGAYLVETSKGEMLLVNRFHDPDPDIKSGHLVKTTDFKVFKISFDEETKELVNQVEVRNLDGDTLFLGTGYSTAIPASGILEPNSIYFTDDCHITGRPKFGHHDIGIFCLEDQSFSQHYKLHPKSDRLLPPSIWTVPPF